jgi:hypothetical protein
VIKPRTIQAGHVALAYKVLVGKCKGNRPLGRHRHRQKNNINVGLKEIDERVWTWLIWFRIGTGDSLL